MQRPFWASFNRNDAKLLLITFAGTVAANLVTVMVAAVAIISVTGSPRPTTQSVVDALIFGVGALALTGLGLVIVRQRWHEPNRRFLNASWIISLISMSFTALYWLLLLVGYVARIK